MQKLFKQLIANPGKTFELLYRSRHKNGEYCWMEGVVTNLLPDKVVNAILFNYRDITQRKEAEEKLRTSEERLRHTMDNMLEGVQIIDFNWRYLYVNNALVKSSHHPKESLLDGVVMELYPGVEQSILYEKLQQCMTERLPSHLETQFVFPNGYIADFELSIQPVPEGIFILSVDITERKKAELALKKSEEH
jgi:PAS domain S-box-containing protein